MKHKTLFNLANTLTIFTRSLTIQYLGV